MDGGSSRILNIAIFYPTRQHAHQVVVLAAMAHVAAQTSIVAGVIDLVWVTYTARRTISFYFIFTAYLSL